MSSIETIGRAVGRKLSPFGKLFREAALFLDALFFVVWRVFVRTTRIAAGAAIFFALLAWPIDYILSVTQVPFSALTLSKIFGAIFCGIVSFWGLVLAWGAAFGPAPDAPKTPTK